MSKNTFERLYGPEWRKVLEEIRWVSENNASNKHKRTNTRPAGKNI